MPTDEQRNRQVESLKRDGLYDDQVKLLGEDDVKRGSGLHAGQGEPI